MSLKSITTRRYVAIVVAAAAAVAVMLFYPRSKAGSETYRQLAGEVWTTEYHITYRGNADLQAQVDSVLRAVDASASVYNERSLVRRLNEGEDVALDSTLLRLLALSRTVHKVSGGAFDPTVMPLVNAWGFGYKHGTLPTQAAIDSILRHVGLDKVTVQGNRLVKSDPQVQLDFSSIAKGLAVDEVARMLERHGVSDYVVEIGGEVRSHGVNAQGQAWHVSVDMPSDDDSHTSALVLAVAGQSVATSGDYRRYRDDGSERVSHIIDPLTGQARESNLKSVTIVAADCMTADAWATACMAMGERRTQAMMEPRGDLGVMTIAIDSLGRYVIWSNAAFAELVVQ